MMISASNDALVDCVAEIAATVAFGPDSIVFHCSGSISSKVLEPLIAKGAHIGSVHSVNRFSQLLRHQRSLRRNILRDGRGRSGCRAFGRRIYKNRRSFDINPAIKAIYHAGSVFASNYLIGVVFAGIRCLEAAGVEQSIALEVLKPIIAGSVDNLFRIGPALALTGPIARGETAVIDRPLKALDPDMSWAYAAMANLTTDVSRQQGRATKESLREIAASLQTYRKRTASQLQVRPHHNG